MRLSVIIPVYNEAVTIEETLKRVTDVNIEKEIIVVDDCSTDGTRDILKRTDGIVLALHDRNLGKGMAIRTALKEVTGDVVIIQDADLEYNPSDYAAIIAPIVASQAQVVYGSRFLNRKPKMKTANYVANRILAIAANVLFNAKITDEATCYKAFRADLLCGMDLKCRRFEFCPEVTAKIRRKGIEILEVPINYTFRTMEQGKKINWWDGVVAMWTLIKYRIVK